MMHAPARTPEAALDLWAAKYHQIEPTGPLATRIVERRVDAWSGVRWELHQETVFPVRYRWSARGRWSQDEIVLTNLTEVLES